MAASASIMTKKVTAEASSPLLPNSLPILLTESREEVFTRLLLCYAVTGLLFMILPGTFLGVMNLFTISKGHAADLVPAPWVQAHGHAQFFGWIGTFIIGIGFYSLPKLQRVGHLPILNGWLCWGLWTIGVLLRWGSNIYQWHWQQLLPISATLELTAFLIFFIALAKHHPQNEREGLGGWALVVVGATCWMLLALILNFIVTIDLAINGNSPIFPYNFNQKFLTLFAWGVLVPMVWGFSARWLPPLLGLAAIHSRQLLLSFALLCLGILATFLGIFKLATIIFLTSVVIVMAALQLYGTPTTPACETHSRSFLLFIRCAYGWLLIAAILGVWAAFSQNPHGIWGASRHALTVGFLSLMIFRIGPRILPLFSGHQGIFNQSLVNISLTILNIGCILRVISQIFAYQGISSLAWQLLPASAVIELLAMSLFFINMMATFIKQHRKPSLTF